MKQRRVNVACVICRRRKTKCDGQRPSCSYCQQTKSPCDYRQIPQDINIPRRHETRTQLMLKIQALQSRLNEDTSASPVLNLSEYTASQNPQSADTVPQVLHPEPIHHEFSNIRQPLCESDEEANVDLLATEAFDEGAGPDIGYFGPSSNHVFFRSLSDLFTRTLTAAPTHRYPRDANISTSTDPHMISGTTDPVTTPSESRILQSVDFPSYREAGHLIDYFFSTIGGMTPFLSKPMVMRHLKRIKQESNKPRGVERALLLIIFALASASTEQVKSFAYYKQALLCLGNERIRGASLDLLQAFTLITVYQQNHQMSITSWTYHALAVKTAFQLGLQSPLAYRRFGQPERDHHLQLWYSLVTQDRILCMCLGRPCLIPAPYVRTPKLHTVQHTMHDYASTYIYDSQSHVYHSQLTSLYEIMASILSQMYHDNIDCDVTSSAKALISARLSMQWELEEWRSNLSPNCRIITGAEMDSDSNLSQMDRFRLILSIHYYRTILIMNAPTILTLLKETLEPALPDHSEFLLEHAVPIVRYQFNALRNLCQILSAVLAKGDLYLDQNNAWWLCNYTSLTVAMHLFALLLFCHNHSAFLASVGIVSTDVRTVLDDALGNMVVVQRSSVMTRKALKCLVKFVQLFDSFHTRQHVSPDRNSRLSASQDATPSVILDPSQYVAQAASDFLGQDGFDSFLGDGIFYEINGAM